ncbi:MAG: Dabb family protein [Bacteroidota bacterium]
MKRFIICLWFVAAMGCKDAKEEVQDVPAQLESKEVVVAENKAPGSFAHNVYIWLKNPESQEDRLAFLESLNKFLNVSTNIQTKHVGTPVASERDVVDDSFSFSIVLTFEDKAAQDRYQDEPAHKLFIEESSHLWEKVLVYDSDNLLMD